jgi:hypothetical protein
LAIDGLASGIYGGKVAALNSSTEANQIQLGRRGPPASNVQHGQGQHDDGPPRAPEVESSGHDRFHRAIHTIVLHSFSNAQITWNIAPCRKVPKAVGCGHLYHFLVDL